MAAPQFEEIEAITKGKSEALRWNCLPNCHIFSSLIPPVFPLRSFVSIIGLLENFPSRLLRMPWKHNSQLPQRVASLGPRRNDPTWNLYHTYTLCYFLLVLYPLRIIYVYGSWPAVSQDTLNDITQNSLGLRVSLQSWDLISFLVCFTDCFYWMKSWDVDVDEPSVTVQWCILWLRWWPTQHEPVVALLVDSFEHISGQVSTVTCGLECC